MSKFVISLTKFTTKKKELCCYQNVNFFLLIFGITSIWDRPKTIELIVSENKCSNVMKPFFFVSLKRWKSFFFSRRSIFFSFFNQNWRVNKFFEPNVILFSKRIKRWKCEMPTSKCQKCLMSKASCRSKWNSKATGFHIILEVFCIFHFANADSVCITKSDQK